MYCQRACRMSELTDRCSSPALTPIAAQSSSSSLIDRTTVVICVTIAVVVQHVQKANTGRQYRAYLTGGATQAAQIAQVDGACRVVGRLAIEHHEMRHSFGGRAPKLVSADLTAVRGDVDWIKAAPVHALQQELRCVEQAFANWYARRSGHPTPRKKKDGVRIKFADPNSDWKVEKVQGKQWRIRLPKIGWIGFVKHRPFGGVIRNVTLTSKAGHWFVSFGIAERRPQATSKPGIIGVDLGVTETIATSRPVDLGDDRGPQRLHRMPPLLSAGEKAHLYALELKAGSLAEARKRRGGKTTSGQRKVFRAIARVHARIARRRKAWLLHVARKLGEFGTVVFEDLRIQNMTRSAKGTAEKPGRNVRAKAGLNKAILNAGWGYLRIYTANQTTVVKVNAQRSSQECRACGHACPGNRPTRDEFACVQCGHTNHADENASEVIEARGSRVLAGDSQPRVVAAHSRKAGGTKNREAKAA